MSKAENEVIALLVKAGETGMTAREIRETLDLKQSTLYAYLDNLIKDGFVFKGERISEGTLYALYPEVLAKKSSALAQTGKTEVKTEKPLEIKNESALEQISALHMDDLWKEKKTEEIALEQSEPTKPMPIAIKIPMATIAGPPRTPQEIGKHYRFSFNGIKLDPYRIFRVYQITEPEQQHAIKKLLRAGNSHKPLLQDIDETIATLQRWKEIIAEDQKLLIAG